MSTLQHEIKLLIISALELEDVTPDDIDADAPLFGEGLGLDSIDALELGVALKKKYQIKLEASDPATKEHFRSVATLAQFVAQQREAQA
ncbi:phosphopantetheine-binding protein [Pseudogulbenkiania sp. MAI-1]|uniref:phosphopantetheine-binding protein n=1 Tax=Pseudogulbenkiania sp. MAI-1 TaxID=990370 RepID=UPI00045E5FA4|nr:phosphopantetheine-binding protein [Pseudogulbenkiania sp. MAI-1]